MIGHDVVRRVKSMIVSILDASLSERRKWRLYRMLGMDIQKGTVIRSGCFFDKYRNVVFGDNVFVNRFCQFHTGPLDAKIKIGDNVRLAMNVTMVCVGHKVGDSSFRAGEHIYGDIVIGKGSWIAANVTILPNVSIGEGCIIAAGAVVTHDCEPNCLYAGVPARKIKELE